MNFDTPHRAPHSLRRLAMGLLASSIFALSACSEPTIEPAAAQSYTAEWAPTLEDALREKSASAAASQALKGAFEKGDEAGQKSGEPPYATLVNQIYREREYEPALVKNATLTPAGEALWNALQLVEDHQLDAVPYRLDELARLFEELESRKQAYADFEGLKPTEAEVAAATAWLTEQPVSTFALTEESHPQLTDALLNAPEGQRLNEALKAYEEKSADVIAIEAKLERLLALGLARYARELRYFRLKEIFVHERHWDEYNEPDSRSTRPDKAKGPFRAGQVWRQASHVATEMANRRKDEIFNQGIQDTLSALIATESLEDAQRVIDGLPPQNPQYMGLVNAFRRYRDIVEAGGWQEVPTPRSLKPGQRSEAVTHLKQRLRIEGFYPEDAPIDEHYDEALEEAVREYQHTHQMVANGRPHNVFWYSVNVPAERRLQQIARNIKRWHSTNTRHAEDDSYVFINIPDFNVELWKEQERRLRFAVVVGNNNKEVNPLTGEEERANQTPTVSAYIDRIIYNPYWNVTPRIRAESILPEVKKQVMGGYAARLSNMLKSATARPTSAPTQGVFRPNLLGSQPGAAPSTAAPQREAGMVGRPPQEDASAQAANAPVDQPARAPAAGDPDDGPAIPVAPEPVDLLESLTTMRSTETGRTRAFKSDLLQRIINHHFPGEDGAARFKAQFPYLDPATGIVDVSVTNPDHIPSWYEENRYEVAFPGRTWEYVRMLPGEDNALGFVKIIFPNLHDIYLHDTPHKPLFSQPVRGYSHGCIRMEQPLTMAEALLELDGQDPNVDRILEGGEYTPIFLTHQVPVHIEYYTVSVDDEGRPHFLADVYGYDEES
ncbi:L,D-transpeptidase family protein [Lujinxingia vulgaris]|uniref:L,D-transpeptidase family protein n=1 Tax=Lujinxingia vulgaris TaxID=2600176 RepID=A0A5C6X4N5_9DELT|nr:L,D-transpeptidase family protein [Lujinxingia vulgaris]TXD36716.1 L,D-transpeptidase family protein [Lujinxingia vulgaris]